MEISGMGSSYPSQLSSVNTSMQADSTSSSKRVWQRRCAALWSTLLKKGAGLERQEILSSRETGGPDQGVICPKHTAATVSTGSTQDNRAHTYIHANRITFSPRITTSTAAAPSSETVRQRHVIAGQSPQIFNHQAELFIAQGIDSGLGLFQFVSPRALRDPARSREHPLLDQLAAKWAACQSSGQSLLLADRYEVKELQEIPATGAQRCYALSVVDKRDNAEKTVRFTQAGLPFPDKVLRVAEIEQAHQMINAHVAANKVGASSAQTDPMLVSHAGIGRNAVLTVYREMLSQIDDGLEEHQLDHALKEVIDQGRRDRGPRFLHSEAQLNELMQALQQVFDKRRLQPALSSGPSPRQSSHQDSLPAELPLRPSSRLLAQAIRVTVPGYLQDHDDAISATRESNLVQQIEQQLARAQQQAQQLAKAQAGRKTEWQDLAQNKLTSQTSQATTADQPRWIENSYRREIADESIEAIFPLPGDGSREARLRTMGTRLQATHDVQQVSAKTREGTSYDQKCWLRSSWLSVLPRMSPDQLATRLLAISNRDHPDDRSRSEATVLRAIASRYHNDPVAFMQGIAPESRPHGARRSWQENFRRPAYLGPGGSVHDIIGKELPKNYSRSKGKFDIELWMTDLQSQIATVYRPKRNRMVTGDSQSQAPRRKSFSDLPVMLHRAMGLPVLVIETTAKSTRGERGWLTNLSTQLRVAAPKDSPLAVKLAQLQRQDVDADTAIDQLLCAFGDLPIIRSSEDHFDLYLPKKLTGVGTDTATTT